MSDTGIRQTLARVNYIENGWVEIQVPILDMKRFLIRKDDIDSAFHFDLEEGKRAYVKVSMSDKELLEVVKILKDKSDSFGQLLYDAFKDERWETL